MPKICKSHFLKFPCRLENIIFRKKMCSDFSKVGSNESQKNSCKISGVALKTLPKSIYFYLFRLRSAEFRLWQTPFDNFRFHFVKCHWLFIRLCLDVMCSIHRIFRRFSQIFYFSFQSNSLKNMLKIYF